MGSEEIIELLEKYQSRLYVKVASGEIEPADPTTLSNNLLLIRGLLVQLTPEVALADKRAKMYKAAEFDKLVRSGEKKTPAYDALKVDPKVIELEVEADRLKGYMKAVDGLCTGIQSVLRTMTGSDKSQY